MGLTVSRGCGLFRTGLNCGAVRIYIAGFSLQACELIVHLVPLIVAHDLITVIIVGIGCFVKYCYEFFYTFDFIHGYTSSVTNHSEPSEESFTGALLESAIICLNSSSSPGVKFLYVPDFKWLSFMFMILIRVSCLTLYPKASHIRLI